MEQQTMPWQEMTDLMDVIGLDLVLGNEILESACGSSSDSWGL